MRHATRSQSRTTALLVAPLVLALGCSDDGWGQPADGTSSGGETGHDDSSDDGDLAPNPDHIPPGIDESGGGVPAAPAPSDCVTHNLRAFAYPIYANSDGVEVVSPGEDAHPLVCVGTGDVSTHGYFAEVTICGPRVTDDVETGEAMLADALAQCEDQLMESFGTYWPGLEEEYEHALEPGEVEAFALSRVACVPAIADADPYFDHAVGSCTGHDDNAVPNLDPLWNEDSNDWDYCEVANAFDCNVPEIVEVAAAPTVCEAYLDQVAMDVVLETDDDRLKATIESTLVESLLSLDVAHCEKNPYDGYTFRAIEAESIFAAVGFRVGDAPQSVQALESGVPVGPKFALGEEPGQEIAAFAGLFGESGEAPTELRVAFDRNGREMTLDLSVQ